MRRSFGVDFDLTEDKLPIESMDFMNRHVAPAASALRERIKEFNPCEFLELILPEGVEYCKAIALPGIPSGRLIVASTWRNCGTEDEPDYRFVRLGRIDCLIEDGKS